MLLVRDVVFLLFGWLKPCCIFMHFRHTVGICLVECCVGRGRDGVVTGWEGGALRVRCRRGGVFTSVAFVVLRRGSCGGVGAVVGMLEQPEEETILLTVERRNVGIYVQ